VVLDWEKGGAEGPGERSEAGGNAAKKIVRAPRIFLR